MELDIVLNLSLANMLLACLAACLSCARSAGREVLVIVAEGTSEDQWSPRAKAIVKNGLQNVKVSEYDATQLQKQLEGELFSKLEETYERAEMYGIAIADIDRYLDRLERGFEGIDKELREKLHGIKWNDHWSHKIYEFKYNTGAASGARYGMVAFAKSTNRKFIDLSYVLYKMDFKIAPQEIVTKNSHSALWGLVTWQTTEREYVERTLGIKFIKQIKNFFMVKALQRFYNEGLIDRINYVPSIEEIDTDDMQK